jgi:uncharacterized surface protein with fasciclin (FAS1) repeats
MYSYNIIRNWTAGSLIALLAVVSGACHKTQPGSGPRTTGKTVRELLQGSFNVSLFNEALNYTGLADSLNGSGPYTIFAPDDAAFNLLGITSAAQIDSMNKDTLTHLLKYHILYGQNISRLSVDSKPNNPFANWDGKTLYLSRPYSGDAVNDDNFMVNGDTVVQADVLASNGVVHSLQTVLNYQTYNTCADYLSADTSFSFFVAALHHFNLYSQLQSAGPITVLAPLNDAFRTVGIDMDSINRMDTTQISSMLFRPYLLTSFLFYSGLESFGNILAYYAPDGSYQIQNIGYYDLNYNYFPGIGALGFDPGTHDQYLLFSTLDGNAVIPVYGYPYSNAEILSQNHPAGNGVVIVIGETLAGPDACRRVH